MALIFLISLTKPSFGQEKQPSFKDYPVAGPYTGLRHLPVIKPASDAWRYRTRIQEIGQRKPNFAGHYSLGTWGCGSECAHFAIVDVKTGAVYYHQYRDCSTDLTYREIPKLFDFRLNSKLLILNCGQIFGKTTEEPHYFKFEHGKLIALR